MMAVQDFSLLKPDKTDHIWYLDKKRMICKCCTCGAVCKQPPNYPTPKTWMPDHFEPLEEWERNLVK